MIATHNIKVNGRWVRAGEEYGAVAQAAPKQTPKTVSEPVKTEVHSEEGKTEVKKPAVRRKVSK